MILAIAGAAQASTFSFAADSNFDGPILQGGPTTSNTSLIRDGSSQNSDGAVQVNFTWDPDGDGPGGSVVIPSRLELLASSTLYSKTNVAGIWIHTYTFQGSYEFRQQSDNVLVMAVQFGSAVWTSVSASEFTWGSTATLQSSEQIDGSIAFASGAPLGFIDLSSSENFAFTLTDLRSLNGGGLVEIESDGTPRSLWKAEASWSAQAVPAPGAMALTLIAGSLVLRRKR
ncbi:MAG: hypothetical protein KF787_11390 [Phycisphaeraceae bacterium]|nr:hypothetical protein [Phycisphaerae bacterium]MBX3393238.1 hypothetical protein [Phycisphaeraceae bacterium]